MVEFSRRSLGHKACPHDQSDYSLLRYFQRLVFPDRFRHALNGVALKIPGLNYFSWGQEKGQRLLLPGNGAVFNTPR